MTEKQTTPKKKASARKPTILIVDTSPKLPQTSRLSKAEKVFRQAARAEYSARLLFNFGVFTNDYRVRTNIVTDSMPPTFIPCIVLDAFAAELYLKSLIMIETKQSAPPRGHNLVTFFSQVSQARQLKIKQAFQRASSNYASAEKALIPQTRKKERGVDFDSLLGVLKNAFSDWRYCYEKKRMKGGMMFPCRISSAVAMTILEVRPKWRTYLDYIYKVSTFPHSSRPIQFVSGVSSLA